MLHTLVSALVIIAVGLSTGHWWPPAAAMVAWFWSREIAQAEYKAIQLWGLGLRANLRYSWLLRRELWDRHSLIGFIGPITAALILVWGNR